MPNSQPNSNGTKPTGIVISTLVAALLTGTLGWWTGTNSRLESQQARLDKLETGLDADRRQLDRIEHLVLDIYDRLRTNKDK